MHAVSIMPFQHIGNAICDLSSFDAQFNKSQIIYAILRCSMTYQLTQRLRMSRLLRKGRKESIELKCDWKVWIIVIPLIINWKVLHLIWVMLLIFAHRSKTAFLWFVFPFQSYSSAFSLHPSTNIKNNEVRFIQWRACHAQTQTKKSINQMQD